MPKKTDRLEELNRLIEELQRARRDSLAASRQGDYRSVARLTAEAARLNRLIIAVEGNHIPSLDQLGDKLFTSETEESSAPYFSDRHPELVAA